MVLFILIGLFLGILLCIIWGKFLLYAKSKLVRTAFVFDDNDDKLVSEILICPFCGQDSANIVNVGTDDAPEYEMVCDPNLGGCGCHTAKYKDAKFAVKQWNTRNNICQKEFYREDEYFVE